MPKICLCLFGQDVQTLILQAKKFCHRVDFFEIRLDLSSNISLEDLVVFRQTIAKPIVLTLRRYDSGGQFKGNDLQYLKAVYASIGKGFDYIDLSFSCKLIENYTEWKSRHPNQKWILSFHSMSYSIPGTIELQKMIDFKADWLKVVVFASCFEEIIQLENIAKKIEKKASYTTVMAMGDKGQFTRIVNPIVYHQVTFVSLPDQTVAPAQLNIEEIEYTYFIHRIKTNPLLFGLIGNPVCYSRGHITHNWILNQLNVNGLYLKFLLDLNDLSPFFQYVRKKDIRGLSVTMPFKQLCMNYLDETDELCQITQSCNTVVHLQGKLKGYNTDAMGALQAIEEHFCIKPDTAIAILGTGATARSIAAILRNKTPHIYVFGRNPRSLIFFKNVLKCKIASVFELWQYPSADFNLLIQTTPVGMSPDIHKSLVPINWLNPFLTVMDVIWHPTETQLIKDAKRLGCPTILGIDMFIHQAAHQFQLWLENPSYAMIVEELRKTLSKIHESSSLS